MGISMLDECFHEAKPNITSRFKAGINKPVRIVRKMKNASIRKPVVLHEQILEQVDWL
jgi:hypothetical protein